MSKVQCKECGGRGIRRDNTGECGGCDGFGILIVEEFRLVPGGGEVEETSVKAEAVKPMEYWPERQVKSVTVGTLNVWRRDLEKREAELVAELGKVRGGMAQLDEELARRNKARRVSGDEA
jgi:hypothetical protein